MSPEDTSGPPVQVAPYYYYTDRDLQIMNAGDPRDFAMTTLTKPAENKLNKTIMNRVATSPLKSCIQNAEVKVAKGGVSVAFDPWKSNKKKNKVRVEITNLFRDNIKGTQ